MAVAAVNDDLALRTLDSSKVWNCPQISIAELGGVEIRPLFVCWRVCVSSEGVLCQLTNALGSGSCSSFPDDRLFPAIRSTNMSLGSSDPALTAVNSISEDPLL